MIALAIHSVVYLTATARIEAAIPAFVSAAEGEGWRVKIGARRRAGWPKAPTIRLDHVEISRISTLIPFVWTTEQIDLVTPFKDWAALHINATRGQIARIPPDPAIDLRVEVVELRIPDAHGDQATLAVQNVVLRTPMIVIQVKAIDGKAQAPLSEASMLGIAATGIQLLPSLPAPFAGSMTGSMQIVGNAVACSSPSSPANKASQSVELAPSEVTWGPLHMTATGRGGLDDSCQPYGQGDLRIKGAVELTDLLAHEGLIATGQASAIRAVIGLLAIAAHGEPIHLPFALMNRTLNVARIPLLRLPVVDWPRR